MYVIQNSLSLYKSVVTAEPANCASRISSTWSC